MRTRSKLLLAGLTAALLLATAVTTASANRLAVNEDHFETLFPELTFAADLGNPIICELTLLGSFHSRTITKGSNVLFGHITHAAIDACQGDGNATVLQTSLPWHLVYESFFEELPNIEGVNVRLIGASFQMEDGITCLVSTDTTEPAGGFFLLDGEGLVTELIANEAFQIDLDNPNFLCELAGDSSFNGTADVGTLDLAKLTYTLV